MSRVDASKVREALATPATIDQVAKAVGFSPRVIRRHVYEMVKARKARFFGYSPEKRRRGPASALYVAAA